MAKQDYSSYEIHGRGIDSLGLGFDALGMPAIRRPHAFTIVREILEANGQPDLLWYSIPSQTELCGYWAGLNKNVLWISASTIHILSHRSVAKPPRPPEFFRPEGDLVGWWLPGAEASSGGGPASPRAAQVLCPAQFVMVPTGQECSYCELVHEA